jgi:hypothetical protein
VAAWQFKIALLPQQWLDRGGALESLFAEEGYSTAVAWQSGDSSVVERRIGNILPTHPSWSSSLLFWGSEETDDIQLWSEAGKISSLVVRFDLRRPNILLFEAIIAAVHDLQLAILDLEHKRAVACDVKSLLKVAAESSAAHFVADPRGFISKVAGESGRAT